MDETRKKEPLIRVEKRKERPAKQVRLLRLASVLLAIVAGGLFILCIGYNPFSVYATIVSGAFRSSMAFQATIKLMVPLLIPALGLTLAFKMRFWNIGADHHGRCVCHIFCPVLLGFPSLASHDLHVFGRYAGRRSVGNHSRVF